MYDRSDYVVGMLVFIIGAFALRYFIHFLIY